MMQKELFEQIDNNLSELITLVPEEEYRAFLKNDTLMRLYEIVDDLDEKKYGILSDNTLEKIARYVRIKLYMYK